MRSTQSAADYLIKEVSITSNKSVQPVIITNNVIQLDLFEHMEKPFLTGNLLIKDDNSIYDSVRFNGTEVCKIVLQQPFTAGASIEKEFIISRVLTTTKTGTQSEVVSLKLLERHAFDNQLIKFSKSYTGNPIQIVESIIKDNLNKNISISSTPPAQASNIKVIVPYMNPLQAADWVRSRASTINGMPFFFYSCLNESNLIIKSLEDMALETSWNEGSPFRFSSAFTNSTINLPEEAATFVVEEFSANNKEDTLSLIQAASVGSSYEMVDATTGRVEKFHFSVAEAFARLKNANIISADMNPVYVNDYKYLEQDIANLPSNNIRRILMTNTHNFEYKNLYQEEDPALFKLDSIAHAIRNMLFKSSITLRVPGIHFLTGRNKSIGRCIDFYYLNNNVNALDKGLADPNQLEDKKRSGKYIIYSAKHTFFNTKHTVDLSAVKLGNKK